MKNTKSFIDTFGKVPPAPKPKSSHKKKETKTDKTQTSIIKSFGKVSKKKEPEFDIMKVNISSRRLNAKPKKKELFHRDIENPVVAFDCEFRVKSDYSFCNSNTCECQYKHMKIENIEYEYNKYMIQTKISKSNLKSWGAMILDFDWVKPKQNQKIQTMIDNFIKQCKFLYDLKEIIGHDTETDLKPIFEILNCKDRVEHIEWGCDKWTYEKKSDQRCKTLSCYCYMNTNKLILEARKRIYINLLTKNGKLYANHWERLALSFDWSNLSDRQQPIVNRFITDYSKLLPKVNSELSTLGVS